MLHLLSYFLRIDYNVGIYKEGSRHNFRQLSDNFKYLNDIDIEVG